MTVKHAILVDTELTLDNATDDDCRVEAWLHTPFDKLVAHVGGGPGGGIRQSPSPSLAAMFGPPFPPREVKAAAPCPPLAWAVISPGHSSVLRRDGPCQLHERLGPPPGPAPFGTCAGPYWRRGKRGPGCSTWTGPT